MKIPSANVEKAVPHIERHRKVSEALAQLRRHRDCMAIEMRDLEFRLLADNEDFALRALERLGIPADPLRDAILSTIFGMLEEALDKIEIALLDLDIEPPPRVE